MLPIQAPITDPYGAGLAMLRARKLKALFIEGPSAAQVVYNTSAYSGCDLKMLPTPVGQVTWAIPRHVEAPAEFVSNFSSGVLQMLVCMRTTHNYTRHAHMKCNTIAWLHCHLIFVNTVGNRVISHM